MYQGEILKQAKGTSREQVETITLIARPVVPYTPEQIEMSRSDLISNLPHTYKVTQTVACASLKEKKFKPITKTWKFEGLDRFSQAQAKFFELVGKFTFCQLSEHGGATLKVTKDEKITY
ncbi:MAG: hypothetical protein ACE5GM_10555 [bacterium]